MSDGTHALKIVFDNIGEIDFIVASQIVKVPSAKPRVDYHAFFAGGIAHDPSSIEGDLSSGQ